MTTTVSLAAVPSVNATYIRGGTSKAVFFHEKDLPEAGPVRDAFLIRIMGSPDPAEIDGMGGSKIVTSKVAIVRPSQRSDADVDYTFAQIGLGDANVSYDGNCGNISAGVGPFAINEGLLKTEQWEDGNRIVRIFNTGIEAVLVAHVPINESTGRALEKGDFQISGCPGTGAPIVMDYSRTASQKVLLPTGNAVDTFDCSFGTVDGTYCSVANPFVFAKAETLGIAGNETPEQLNNNTDLLARIRELRGKWAQKLGYCKAWEKVDEQSPMLPMVALVSPPTSQEGHVQSRLFLDNHCHPSMAGTGGICTTAASCISGSIVDQVKKPMSADEQNFNVQHPAGHLPIRLVASYEEKESKLPSFQILGFVRTSRYLMQGLLFVPEDFQHSFAGSNTRSAVIEDNEEPKAVQPASGSNDEQALEHPAAEAMPTSEPGDVTKRLVEFVSNTKYSDLSQEADLRIRQCLLDFLGVAVLGAKVGESSMHFKSGIDAMTEGFPGDTTVFGTSKRYPTQYAALLNGAFGHTLDFDDTHSAGVIHVAVSVMSASLAESESHSEMSFEDFVTAAAVGYEVAVRISISLGVSAWHRGFHLTSVAGIFGAVAAICRLRKVSAEVIANAFGLACSFASGSMQYLENGAWNKRLHPAKAAHDAFLVVAFAQAGVLGAAKPIEGKLGLVAAHTDGPQPPVNVADLGKRWELVNTGLKPYPGCRVTHTCIELASIMADATQRKPVKSIHIFMDPSGYPIVGLPTPNKIHPDNTVDAQFSSYWQTAASFLLGDDLGWAVYDHVNDPEVHKLTDKITIDPKPMPKNLSAEMTITLEDGESLERTIVDPKWEEPERPATNEEVAQKFLALTKTILGGKTADEVVKYVTGPLDTRASTLLALLQQDW